MRLRYSLLNLVGLTVLMSLGFALLNSPKVAAGNYTNYLIDDSVMRATSTMSQTDIQAFLQNEGSGLATFSDVEDCGPTTGAHYAYYAQYYSCGSMVSAAKIIHDASQAYGINPQVLLATMQKEQSLVTTPNPTSSQLNCAMGYYSCGNYVGFFNQVDGGAWQFRTYYELGSGNNWWGYTPANYPCSTGSVPTPSNGGNVGTGASYYSTGLYPGRNVTFYDYNGNPYTNFIMPNISTAGLYCYTPHVYPGSSANYFSGSYWFVYYFNQWFGSTTGTIIIKSDTDPTFYLYDQGMKFKIPSAAIYYAYGFNNIATTVTSSAYISSIPSGNDLTTLVKDSSGYVQLVSNDHRYTVTPGICAAWGLQCTNPSVVTTLDASALNSSSWATYLTPLMYNQGVIYEMQNGQKLPFLNSTAMAQNGYSPSQVLPVEDANATQPLGPVIPSADTAFKLNNGNIMLYTGGQYIYVSSPDLFYRWGLDSIYYPSIPASSWDTQPPTANATLSDGYIGYGNTKVLLDGGRKIDVSAASNDWPAAPNTSAYMSALLNRLPLVSVNNATCFRTSTGDLVRVQGGQRRSIRLVADLYLLGCQPSNLVQVQDSSLSMLSSGPADLTQNRLFQVAGSPGIYMVTSGNSSVELTSYDYVSAFGQYPSDVALVDSTTLANYAPSGSVSSLGGNASSGTYFLYSPSGSKYYFSSAVFSAWGINKQTIPTYDNKIGAIDTPSPATQFARTPDGSIYYGSGGSKHLLTSWSAFVSLGGTPSNTMNVLADFIANVPTGANIN